MGQSMKNRRKLQQQLIGLTDVAGLQAAGLPFKSVYAARWDYRNRDERGTQRAYVKVGRRIYIDPERYHKAIRTTK